MSREHASRSLNDLGGTLGTGRSLGRRLLLHHLPLAVVSTVILVLLLGLPTFEPGARAHADITSGAFPQQRDEADAMDMDHGEGEAAGLALRLDPGSRTFATQVTVTTGYVATVLLALTLIIGPANLLLRRRNPVSSYLRRDAGTWTAAFSILHVIFALQAEKVRSGIFSFVDFFVADGRPLTNSFGWGNWTGFAATVIVVGLLATSTDRSLRELKARRWKNIQRLNYALIALVIAHTFFYGLLVRMTSPFTVLLFFIVIAVLVGQAIGIRLWRQRQAGSQDHHQMPESASPNR